MARKRSRKSKAPAVQRAAAKKRKRNKKKKAVVTIAFPDNASRNYMQLVKDPCYGPLTRSVGSTTGTTLIQRVRSSYVNAATSGYFAWFPSYHGHSAAVGSFRPYNLFWYEGVAGNRPVNTSASPMGMGNSDTGAFLIDPAARLLTGSSPFSQAKTIAACITTEYMGSMANAAGIVAKVANISLTTFIPQPGATDPRPLSITEVFAYAAHRARMEIEGDEVRWRPTEGSALMRDAGLEGSTASIPNGANMPNTCFWSGSPGSAATAVSCADPENMTGIVIAYQGVPVGSLNFNFVKVVELELSSAGGIEEPRGAAPQARGTTITRVVDVLDSLSPGWQTAASEMAHSAARSVFRTAVNAFAAPARTRPMQSYLRDLD